MWYLLVIGWEKVLLGLLLWFPDLLVSPWQQRKWGFFYFFFVTLEKAV